ncbi:hypothetical protein BKA62DRAFT_761248 [Auriculariales sp. MPI-PUGE-AT-0066]|nr:hypothetical protein BKA62DRAFT_761248 [Auriculariales sp. MPI-PUGE-AT-0066]
MSWQLPTLDMAILDVLHLRVQQLEGLLRLNLRKGVHHSPGGTASLPHRISGQELHSSNIRSAPDWANSVASHRREVAGLSSNGAMQCAKQRLLDVAARLRLAWAVFELVVRNLTLCAHHREHVIRILKQASGDVRLVTIAGLLDAGRATYHSLIAQYQTAQDMCRVGRARKQLVLEEVIHTDEHRYSAVLHQTLSTLGYRTSMIHALVADSSLSVHGLLEQLHHLETRCRTRVRGRRKGRAKMHRVLQALPETVKQFSLRPTRRTLPGIKVQWRTLYLNEDLVEDNCNTTLVRGLGIGKLMIQIQTALG